MKIPPLAKQSLHTFCGLHGLKDLLIIYNHVLVHYWSHSPVKSLVVWIVKYYVQVNRLRYPVKCMVFSRIRPVFDGQYFLFQSSLSLSLYSIKVFCSLYSCAHDCCNWQALLCCRKLMTLLAIVISVCNSNKVERASNFETIEFSFRAHELHCYLPDNLTAAPMICPVNAQICLEMTVDRYFEILSGDLH